MRLSQFCGLPFDKAAASAAVDTPGTEHFYFEGSSFRSKIKFGLLENELIDRVLDFAF